MTSTNRYICLSCSKEINDKDTIALNRKMLGRGILNFFCIECLANYLGTNAEYLFDKIEEFKEQGCTLFD